MTNKEEFEYFVEQLHNNAVKEFNATEQYSQLREKSDRMDMDCETILNPGEQIFVTECFDLISDIDSQKQHYVYRQGLLDSVKILKWLGVLA